MLVSFVYVALIADVIPAPLQTQIELCFSCSLTTAVEKILASVHQLIYSPLRLGIAVSCVFGEGTCCL
jgi:hypothetical protein